jgi:hypothetical protein
MKLCRICRKDFKGSHNCFYCQPCREALYSKGARRWRIDLPNGSVWVWLRHNSLTRVVYEGKNIEPVFELTEVIE